MKIRNLGLILLLLIGLIAPVSAGGITVAPVSLNGDGTFDVINSGKTTMNYEITFSQILLKNGVQEIIDNIKAPIIVDKTTFKLAPGESTKISVKLGDTQNRLYGVRVTGKPDIQTNDVMLGVSAIVKINNGVPTQAVESLNIVPKYLPIALSGVAFNVNYDVENTGNYPVTYMGKTFYPGDNANLMDTFSTGVLDFGFKEYHDGVKVFIFPTPVFLLGIFLGAFGILRRKVSVQLK